MKSNGAQLFGLPFCSSVKVGVVLSVNIRVLLLLFLVTLLAAQMTSHLLVYAVYKVQQSFQKPFLFFSFSY